MKLFEDSKGHIRDRVKSLWLSKGEREEHISQAMKDFEKLKQSRVIRGPKSDISRYTKTSFKDFVNQNKNLEPLYKEKIERKERKSSIERVWSSLDVDIIIPKTIEAACKYGTRTNWCNAAKSSLNPFNEYTYKKGMTQYFLLFKKDLDKDLMYDKKDVRIFHRGNEKAFEEVKPENYRKVGVDILRPETKEVEKQDMMLIWDSLNNLMRRNWFKRLCERYKIPMNIFTIRTKKIDDKYEI